MTRKEAIFEIQDILGELHSEIEITDELKNACKMAIQALEQPGKTEARPTGKWIKISPAEIYECSECGQNVMTQDIDVYKYCHGCGVKMEREDKE